MKFSPNQCHHKRGISSRSLSVPTESHRYLCMVFKGTQTKFGMDSSESAEAGRKSRVWNTMESQHLRCYPNFLFYRHSHSTLSNNLPFTNNNKHYRTGNVVHPIIDRGQKSRVWNTVGVIASQMLFLSRFSSSHRGSDGISLHKKRDQ